MKILSLILAGGTGTRLFPLTTIRAKPAVPFGGNYRIIDFVLSNFLNSGLRQIYLLTQFKSHSLHIHLRKNWRMSGMTDAFIDPVPAQMQMGSNWYRGTADAVFQNSNLISYKEHQAVCIFSGDHIYRMDIQQMLAFHQEKKAALTVAALLVPVDQAYHFGVIEVDKDGKMIGFIEKPKENPPEAPHHPGYVLASMGNYIFDTKILMEYLEEDQNDLTSSYDFGKNIIPNMFKNERVFVYNFQDNKVPGSTEKDHGYWKDVGTIDAYWKANLDLVHVDPIFNLYNREWPIVSQHNNAPPAKFVHSEDFRTGIAVNSLVSDGCIVSGALVKGSVLSPHVRVHSYTEVHDSVILENVEIGRNCKIQHTIIDKDVFIPANTTIGYDLEADRQRFTVTENGVVVVPKGYQWNV